jgi:hypothetical protein
MYGSWLMKITNKKCWALLRHCRFEWFNVVTAPFTVANEAGSFISRACPKEVEPARKP